MELDEDPEIALGREIREECGLKVRILAKKPDIAHSGVKPLLRPSYMDVHRAEGRHKHIAFVYFAKAKSSHARLHKAEHRALRWFSRAELYQSKYHVYPSIRFYCLKALAAARRVR